MLLWFPPFSVCFCRFVFTVVALPDLTAFAVRWRLSEPFCHSRNMPRV